MSVLGEARSIFRRWRESASGGSALDGLLARAGPAEPFEARLRWLGAVAGWVGRADPAPVTCLRHLLNVLDRNPEWKARVARALCATLRDADALELSASCRERLPQWLRGPAPMPDLV